MSQWPEWVEYHTRHLEWLPDTVMRMRETVTPPLVARLGERVTGGGFPDDAPLSVQAVGDSDTLWGLLADFRKQIVDVAGQEPPAIPGKVPVSSSEAWRAAYVLCAWLIDRPGLSVEHPSLQAVEDALFRQVRRCGFVYGEAERKPTRRCKQCGVRAVTVVWADDSDGVTGKTLCKRCGKSETITASRPEQFLLTPDRSSIMGSQSETPPGALCTLDRGLTEPVEEARP